MRHSRLNELTHWGISADIFKYIYLYENCCIMIQIALNFVPEGPIDEMPLRRQAIIWTNECCVYWCVYLSPGLKELRLWDLCNNVHDFRSCMCNNTYD